VHTGGAHLSEHTDGQTENYFLGTPITLLNIVFYGDLVGTPITLLNIVFYGYLVGTPITLFDIVFYGDLVGTPITLFNIVFYGYFRLGNADFRAR
jgi:hypothetical protein